MQALVWHPKRRNQPVLIPRETVLWVLVKVGLGLRARVAIGSDNATLIFATVKYLIEQNKSSLMIKPT